MLRPDRPDVPLFQTTCTLIITLAALCTIFHYLVG